MYRIYASAGYGRRATTAGNLAGRAAVDGQLATGNWPEQARARSHVQRIAHVGVLCSVLALMAGLAGCGSMRSAPEERSASAQSEKPAAQNAPANAAAAQAPIPAEAAQQFESAVDMMGSGNDAGAEQAFRALSAAYPTYSGALLNLGILQAKAGKLDEAEQTLRSALERNPTNAATFNQLGIVYRRLGRFDEADQAYQRALQADPSYALAHLNLGVLCDLYLQQPQRALVAYERYLQLASEPDAKVNGWITVLKARLGAEARSARAET
jgi:Flp pilus assembly protein TadD